MQRGGALTSAGGLPRKGQLQEDFICCQKIKIRIIIYFPSSNSRWHKSDVSLFLFSLSLFSLSRSWRWQGRCGPDCRKRTYEQTREGWQDLRIRGYTTTLLLASKGNTWCWAPLLGLESDSEKRQTAVATSEPLTVFAAVHTRQSYVYSAELPP